MTVVDDKSPILDRYFKAWQSLNPAQVHELFHGDATYERQGKPPLSGIDQIEAYWQRNQVRQTRLNVFQYVPLNGQRDACTFCARFVDSEERQTQTVFGWMTLEVEKDKILRLREGYNVHREPLAAKSNRTWWNWVCDNFKRTHWKIVEWWTRLVEFLAVQGNRIVYYLLLVVLGGSALGIGMLPDIALCALALKFSACGVADPTLRTALEGDAIRHLGYIALIAVFLLPILHKFRHSFLVPVETIRLVGEGQDLEEMKTRFRGAQHLIIHAGDFDFVGRDAEFRAIFAELDDASGLELVSDKSEDAVRTGFGNEPEAVLLLDSLLRRGRIRFEDSRRLRCSIVRRWDYPEVLYRYEHGGGEEERHRLRICVLRGRGEMSPVVDLLRRSARCTT